MILFHTSSVPINKPTAHSRTCIKVLYQLASSKVSLTIDRACGPKIIPVISQPRIAGSLNLDTNFPIKKAIIIVTTSLKIKDIIYSLPP